MYCPNCGQPMANGAVFCGNCGARLGYAPKPKKSLLWLFILLGLVLVAAVTAIVLWFFRDGRDASAPLDLPGSVQTGPASGIPSWGDPTAEPAWEGPAAEPAWEGPAEEAAVPDAPKREIRVALLVDFGGVNDNAYNQAAYEACRAYCDTNALDFRYYGSGGYSDEDFIRDIRQAVADGFNVIVLPGYMFGYAVSVTASEYPDVYFLCLDMSPYDILAAGQDTVPANVCCVTYQEELGGFMAGYAAVKMGYRKLGFLGGMAVPAVVRYGIGFVQGAEAAAVELGLNDVVIDYAYANQFFGDDFITAKMDDWYAAGTEAVFACGGGIYMSVAEAAAKTGGKIIGLDVDQSYIIDSLYGKGITLTSAMKAFGPTVSALLDEIGNDSFPGGRELVLGLVSEDPEQNFVQLPYDSTQFGSGFSREDYRALVSALLRGRLSVSADVMLDPSSFASKVTVIEWGNLR